jgi:transcriptional regulator with XRE-family HTH domain
MDMQEDQVEIIIRNVQRLMELRGVPSGSALAKMAKLNQATVSKLLEKDEISNPTMRVLESIASALGVPAWMLLILDFPYQSVAGRKPLTRLSDEGYLVLRAFESAQPMVRYAILEAVAHATCKTDEKASCQIKDMQSKYL